jgi:hypothetical protein
MLRRIALLVLAVSLVGVACGDDTPTSTTSGAATTLTPETTGSTEPTSTAPTARQPTEEEIHSAALLFDWPVTFTKIATIVPSPIGEMDDGTVYMITLEVEGICDDASNCIQESNAHVDNPAWGWTITEPLVDAVWSFANGRWAITMDGAYLSAEYGNGNACIYAWSEAWDIEVSDAVQNGDGWLATAFSGTMVRSEGLDPARSAQGIANGYCPEYQNVTEWKAESVRVKTAVP